MVKGLDTFINHFRDYSDQYVIIGGAACSVGTKALGHEFRVTKDIDIVLLIEALTPTFGATFWDFIREGRYQIRQRNDGKGSYFRFKNPANDATAFPGMLELFSVKPELFADTDGCHLTPIPLGEDVSSLSAIILDDNYYDVILAGKMLVDDLPVVSPGYLIPLKAKAYLDLSTRKLRGEPIDSKDINKHQKDIYRLFRAILPKERIALSTTVRADLMAFIEQIDRSFNLRSIGIPDTSVVEIIDRLRQLYSL